MATISFQCYSCHQVLKVGADKAGKRGKCPKCGTKLTIPVASAAPAPAPPPPPPAPLPAADYVQATAPVKRKAAPPRPAPAEPAAGAFDELEEVPPPEPRRRRDEEESYDEPEDYPVRRGAGFPPAARARVGLLIVFIAFCIVAGAFVLELIVYLISSIQLIKLLTGSMGEPTGRATEVLWKIAFPLAFCGSLTAIVGYVFCITGPNRRGSMGVAIATVAVAAIGLIVTLIFRLLPLFGQELLMTAGGRGGGGGGGGRTSLFLAWFLLVLPQLFFCAEIILFPFYLRAVGLARKKYWVANDAGRVVVLGVAYSVVRLLGWIVIYVMTQSSSPGLGKAMGWIFLLLLWGGTVLYILQLMQYLFLLWRTRPLVK